MTAAAIDRDELLLSESCSDSVTEQIFTKASSHDPLALPVLPQGLAVVRGLVSAKFSVRVLAYLAEAEQKTEVATEQQDYRIAWITVLRADEGNQEPWRQAFWEIVGNTPEKAIPFWMCKADLLADDYVPLSMIDLRYTKDWGGDYIRAKMAADAARAANLPPKKPVTSLPDFTTVEAIRARRKREQSKGFSVAWPIVFAAAVCLLMLLWLFARTSRTFSYTYPDSYLRVVANLDSCDAPDGTCGKRYLVQAVEQGFAYPETEMHFRDPQRFEAGHTFKWIRFKRIGSEVVTDGWDTLKGADGLPVLAPNCKPDYSKAPTAGHIRCEGGKARF